MNHTLKQLPKSLVEFSITVPFEEYEAFLPKSATRISHRVAVSGFRKGHVPYEIIKREVGELTILQEAAEEIIQKTFFEALGQEHIHTIGQPQIAIEKLAPGNDFVFKATVATLPHVKLPDLSKISVEKKNKILDIKEADETITALRGMQAKEVSKDGIAEGTDKLVIDMDMFIDNVPMDGGQAKDYAVYLSEDHYIPGFNEAVKGLKKDETKEFTLTFPKTHYQKTFAGKDVLFKVKVKEVMERQLPEANDEFAKALGKDTLEELRDLVLKNMQTEADKKSDQQAEIEMLNTIIEKCEFEEIPDLLVDSERQKMFYELKRDLEKNGVSIEQYLADIKKDEKALYEEFRVQAEQRAKAALLSRSVAEEEKLEVSEGEIDAEIEVIKVHYKDDKESTEKLQTADVRYSIATMLQNKKVIAFLRAKVLKEGKAEAEEKKETKNPSKADKKKKAE
jgi:trigger factor